MNRAKQYRERLGSDVRKLENRMNIASRISQNIEKTKALSDHELKLYFNNQNTRWVNNSPFSYIYEDEVSEKLNLLKVNHNWHYFPSSSRGQFSDYAYQLYLKIYNREMKEVEYNHIRDTSVEDLAKEWIELDKEGKLNVDESVMVFNEPLQYIHVPEIFVRKIVAGRLKELKEECGYTVNTGGVHTIKATK